MKLLREKWKVNVVIRIITTFVMVCLLCACGSDSPEVIVEKPTLELNPLNLTFSTQQGDRQNLEIKTTDDATWTVYPPEWLSASSTNGKGSMIITLTTNSENKGGKMSDQIQVVAKNEAGLVSERITVNRDGKVVSDCYARIVMMGDDEQKIVMTYGFACAIETGDNTKYFLYKVFTKGDFENLRDNNDLIAADAVKSGSTWKRENIQSRGGIDIIYDNCDAQKSYVFVTVAYDSEGNRGEIGGPYDFTTKDASESNQPEAFVTPQPTKVEEVHDSNQGPWYKWDTKLNGRSRFYITYACASDVETATMKNRKAAFGEVSKSDGIKLAWDIWKKTKESNLQNDDNDPGFNSDFKGAREILFGKNFRDATQWIEYRSTDKYLQLATWAFTSDDFTSYSGIIRNVLYKVEDGKLIPQPNDDSVILDASPLSLNFQAVGGADDVKSIHITSNTDWTASSSTGWCHLKKTFGTNSSDIEVWCDQNDGTSMRQGIITVKASSGKYVEIKVVQVEKSTPIVVGFDKWDGPGDSPDKSLDNNTSITYTLDVSPTSISTAPAGESKNIVVTSNDSWNVSSNQSWCSASPSSGFSNGVIQITTSKNTSPSSRNATITIRGSNSGSKTILVTQDEYTLSVNQSSLQIKSEGESKTVSITSNDTWTVSSNQSWCVISPSNGSSNGTVTIKVSVNASSARTATVTIKGNNSGKTATISISQDAGTIIGRDEYGNDKEI